MPPVTPPNCVADFCLIPMGINTVSLTPYIAEVQKLLKDTPGITYHMHGCGTTVEGSWDDVTRVIGQAHSILHEQGVIRVHSDIRIGSRTDKSQTARDKQESVEQYLRKHI